VTVSRLLLSFPTDLSSWGRDQLETPWMRAYLRRVFDGVRPGEQTEVFLDVGCCGDTLDVPLRVERIDGDGAVDTETAITFEERAACGLAGGWRVQSRAGPSGGD